MESSPARDHLKSGYARIGPSDLPSSLTLPKNKLFPLRQIKMKQDCKLLLASFKPSALGGQARQGDSVLCTGFQLPLLAAKTLLSAFRSRK